MDHLALDFKEIAGLRVADRNGNVLYSTDRASTPNANVSDRDYFRQLRDTPKGGLVFSEVFTGRITRRSIVVGARALTDGHGNFMGVVFAPLELEHFQALFQSLAIGPQGVISWRRSDDRRLVLRWPNQAGIVNQPLSPQNPIAKQIATGGKTGTLHFPGERDALPRIFSYHALQGYPFYVTVSLSRDNVLAEWRTRSLAVGASGLVSLCLLAWLLHRLWLTSARETQVTAVLKESDERNRTMLAVSPDGIWIHTNARIIYVNDALVKMLGYDSPRELVGREIFEFFVPEYREKLRQRVDQVVTKLAPRAPLAQAAMLRRDGSRLEVETTAAGFRQNDALCSVAFIRDITERQLAEARRAQLEAQLRESQKMEALGTLAGGVAHDFNNALAAITGNVELARQDVGLSHPALVSLEEIGKASRRAKDLVQQILTFGRRQKLERKPTALALVVVESARLMRATLPASVTLRVDCKADTPAVLADATQVKQILLNLCGNALQAVQDMERPGVIEVRLEACTLGEARGDLRPGQYACLTVQDNGSGMDEATRSRVFEPFFTTKPVGKGTGLGLSVVHGIVKAHEAGIEVESTLGEGSAFRIYFPTAEASVTEIAAPAPGAAPVHVKGQHVLYVDDEEAIVFLMQRLLERQGYRVSGYTDPREALAAARADPGQFDLAVTDYNMPGMSGLDVAQALKAIRADLPVVLASGFITEELRAKAPACGVDAMIYKPDTADELCRAVARFANEQAGAPL
jgi:PAS domain S-box-containing protein